MNQNPTTKRSAFSGMFAHLFLTSLIQRSVSDMKIPSMGAVHGIPMMQSKNNKSYQRKMLKKRRRRAYKQLIKH